MKKLLLSAVLLLATTTHAANERLDAAASMGQKLGALPTTMQLCGKHTPSQQAEMRQVLAQLESRFSAVQGADFAARYREGFQSAEAAAKAGAAQYKNGPPKELAATCDAFVTQYPTMLEGLRRLAQKR